jgi:hypothetical protein
MVCDCDCPINGFVRTMSDRESADMRVTLFYVGLCLVIVGTFVGVIYGRKHQLQQRLLMQQHHFDGVQVVFQISAVLVFFKS